MTPKEKQREYNRKYREKNRERVSKQQSLAARKRTYGLTTEQVNDLLVRGCGICGSLDNPRIDHDHATGKVRGVLCHKHNIGLGQFDDDPDMLRLAARWVEEHR